MLNLEKLIIKIESVKLIYQKIPLIHKKINIPLMIGDKLSFTFYFRDKSHYLVSV